MKTLMSLVLAFLLLFFSGTAKANGTLPPPPDRVPVVVRPLPNDPPTYGYLRPSDKPHVAPWQVDWYLLYPEHHPERMNVWNTWYYTNLFRFATWADTMTGTAALTPNLRNTERAFRNIDGWRYPILSMPVYDIEGVEALVKTALAEPGEWIPLTPPKPVLPAADYVVPAPTAEITAAVPAAPAALEARLEKLEAGMAEVKKAVAELKSALAPTEPQISLVPTPRPSTLAARITALEADLPAVREEIADLKAIALKAQPEVIVEPAPPVPPSGLVAKVETLEKELAKMNALLQELQEEIRQGKQANEALRAELAELKAKPEVEAIVLPTPSPEKAVVLPQPPGKPVIAEKELVPKVKPAPPAPVVAETGDDFPWWLLWLALGLLILGLLLWWFRRHHGRFPWGKPRGTYTVAARGSPATKTTVVEEHSGEHHVTSMPDRPASARKGLNLIGETGKAAETDLAVGQTHPWVVPSEWRDNHPEAPEKVSFPLSKEGVLMPCGVTVMNPRNIRKHISKPCRACCEAIKISPPPAAPAGPEKVTKDEAVA